MLLKSKFPRLVVRKTNKNIIAQIVKYSPKGDVVVSSSTSKELKKYEWPLSRSNIPTAYLVGFLLAKKTPEKKAIFDMGLQTPVAGSKLFAVIKGCVDGGLDVPYSEEVLPDEDRIKGKHISDYAALLDKDNSQEFKKRFSSYINKKINLTELSKYFETTKNKISESVNKNAEQ